MSPAKVHRPERRDSPDRYSRPSRPRIRRADWVASVASTPERKRELANARQAQYRARKKAS